LIASFALLGTNTSRWSVVKLRSSLLGSHTIIQYIYLGPVAGRDRYHLYNEATKRMINSCDVVFHENIFKVSNKHTTITTPLYVKSDTVFIDNSTSAQLDNIKDDLTN
jgi:hypothetical protein